jgi:hypothetical protein
MRIKVQMVIEPDNEGAGSVHEVAEPQGPLPGDPQTSRRPPLPPWRSGVGCVPRSGCNPELRRIVEIGALNLW